MFRYFRISLVTNKCPFFVVDTAGREFRVSCAVGAAFDLGFGVVEIAVEGLNCLCYAVFLLGRMVVSIYMDGMGGCGSGGDSRTLRICSPRTFALLIIRWLFVASHNALPRTVAFVFRT